MSSTARQIEPGPEGRQHPRTHLFVAATLYADSASTPVHIRNMSDTGAMIEAGVLPGVGERITLKRGKLEAAGWIAWRAGRRAGVRLEAMVHVADWMSRQVNAGQERVDALLSAVRGHGSNPAALPGAAQMSVEAELEQLRIELTAMENALLADVIVAATHPEIQTFDISLQRIDRILKRLRGASQAA